TGDVLLNGTIDNPIGTTSIVNTRGSMLSTDDRDHPHTDFGIERRALVRSNILHIAAPGSGQDVGTPTERVNIDVVDAAGLPQPVAFETRRVNDASNTIFLGFENRFYQGQQVRYHAAGTAITGLTDGGYYYVIAGGDGLSLKLASSAANAAANLAID